MIRSMFLFKLGLRFCSNQIKRVPFFVPKLLGVLEYLKYSQNSVPLSKSNCLDTRKFLS